VRSGFFLALEGLDGAGKTTLAAGLKKSLVQKGYDPICLKEPTSGQYGQKIREITRLGRPESLSPEDELALFINDRAYDVENNINPALEGGKVVIIDRYIVSNLAYQGALGLPLDLILKANQDFPWPDLTLVLTIVPSEGLDRVRKRGDLQPAFERVDYLQSVKAVFDRLDALSLKNIFFIDAGKAARNLVREALLLINPLLPKPQS
jgi:dTMP kinase